MIKIEKKHGRCIIKLFGFIKINFRLSKFINKTICISGNCTTVSLQNILKNYTNIGNKYNIKLLKPIFLVTFQDTKAFLNDVKKCDILISQSVTGEKYKKLGIDTDSLKSKMKKDAKLILIPTPYFTGYFPEQFYMHDDLGNLVEEHSGLSHPYHNRIIFKGYLDNLSPEQVLNILESEVNLKDITKTAQNSIDELKKREKNLSFGISDYICENYKKKRLFWTINHPSNYVIEYMVNKILEKLNFKEKVSLVGHKEYLDVPYRTPILNSVVKELNLENIENSENIEKYTLEIINSYYKYYDEHPELVNLNEKNLNKKYIETM